MNEHNQTLINIELIERISTLERKYEQMRCIIYQLAEQIQPNETVYDLDKEVKE